MNDNRGVGLAELIIFIFAALLILVVCTITYSKNFGDLKQSEYDEEDNSTPTITSTDTNTNSTYKEDSDDEDLSKIEKQYKILTDKMVNTAKIYISNNYTGKTDQIIIKTSTLIGENYMEKLIDPNNNTNECSGYIIYDGNDNYDPYINCGGNYKTEGYNNSFE